MAKKQQKKTKQGEFTEMNKSISDLAKSYTRFLDTLTELMVMAKPLFLELVTEQQERNAKRKEQPTPPPPQS